MVGLLLLAPRDRMLALTQEDRPDDHAREGGDPDRAEPPLRERLAEDRHPGDDRQGIREQRGDARRRQGAAALEAGLEDERSERVSRDQRRDEGEVAVGRLDGAFRRDVARGEEEAGSDAVGRRGSDTAAEELDRDERRDRRRADPETDAQVAGAAAFAVASR